MATDSGKQPPSPSEPDAALYLSLLKQYQALWDKPANSRGNELEFLFRKLITLINIPCRFNRELPLPFREVAEKFARHERSTLAHFRYDENRQFFISDLHDYLRIFARQRPN